MLKILSQVVVVEKSSGAMFTGKDACRLIGGAILFEVTHLLVVSPHGSYIDGIVTEGSIWQYQNR